MPRRKPKDAAGQIGLFTRSVVKGPESLSHRLLSKGLISKKSRKVNVPEEIDKAFARIQGFKGINVADLVQALKGKSQVSAESVLKAAVRHVERTPEEKKAIANAIERIVWLVNRKKRADFWRMEHARSRASYGEISNQQKHLESIKGN